MKRPTVSIILPVYNAEPYLRKCLDSIIGQSYDKLDVLVAEDNSTDLSVEIIKEYAAKDTRIQLLHQQVKGVSSARNAALDKAIGEYIVMVDADDELHPQAVENLLNAIETTGADIALGRWSQNREIALAPIKRLPKPKTYTPTKALELTLYQRKGFDPSPWAKMYKSTIFEKVRFRPGIRFEDLDIIDQIYAHAHLVATIDVYVYYYRRNPVSFINTPSRERLDCLEVTRLIEERATASANPRLLAAARERRLSAAFNMLGLCQAQGWTDEYHQCQALIRRYRLATILSPCTRLKSRLGAILSYLLPSPLLARILPRS